MIYGSDDKYLNSYFSRSMWDSFTLGIRCPTDGSTCAALAKEPVTDEDQVGYIFAFDIRTEKRGDEQYIKKLAKARNVQPKYIVKKY